jgi:hypothetical protein
MVRGVRDQLSGQVGQPPRKMPEMADADGDDHALGRNQLTGGGLQLVAVRGTVQREHAGVLQVGYEPLLELEAIVGERLQRHGDAMLRVAQAVPLAVGPQRVGAGRVRQAGGAALGLEEHAGRHVRPPRLHGAAEDAEWHAVPAQMGGNR